MDINPPERVRVMLTGLSWSLHVTTVPFNMVCGVAVTLRVDVRSDSDGLTFSVSEMRVAVKTLRSIGCPKALPSANRTGLLNAVLLHSRRTPPVTMHVRVTSCPGHMPPWALEVSVTTPSKYQHIPCRECVTCVHVHTSM